jgi:hypothetical protein
MSVPAINAHPKTKIEIKDSCDCSCDSSCWPGRKARHIRKPRGQDKRVDEVAKSKAGLSVL